MNLTNWEHDEDWQIAWTPTVEVEGMHISAYSDFVECATYVTLRGNCASKEDALKFLIAYTASIGGYDDKVDSDHWAFHLTGEYLFDMKDMTHYFIFGMEEIELAKEKCKEAV